MARNSNNGRRGKRGTRGKKGKRRGNLNKGRRASRKGLTITNVEVAVQNAKDVRHPLEDIIDALRNDLKSVTNRCDRYKRMFFDLKDMIDYLRELVDEEGFEVPDECDHLKGNEWNFRGGNDDGGAGGGAAATA